MKNQNIHLGAPSSITSVMERNIYLNVGNKTVDVIKLGETDPECSVDINNKSAGFAIGADATSVYLTITDPIPPGDVGPILSMTTIGNPFMEIAPDGTSAFFVGTEDIRIGKATLTFDGEAKFNIRYESSTDRFYVEIHKPLEIF
ncbi:MAG: hypothetical protein KDC44_02365 [Phaeodactylibacter sp.]|nr:hypothetical protein [Phaeodactylibacter sp.]